MKDANDIYTQDLVHCVGDAQASAAARGRPRVYASAAERQRAYRARLKERGMREISRIVRDVREPQPLHSDVIDLSEVRRW